MVNVDESVLYDFLMEHTDIIESRGLNVVPHNLVDLKHGSCCVCGGCGYYNDECVCIHNDVVTAIKEVFSL